MHRDEFLTLPLSLRDSEPKCLADLGMKALEKELGLYLYLLIFSYDYEKAWQKHGVLKVEFFSSKLRISAGSLPI